MSQSVGNSCDQVGYIYKWSFPYLIYPTICWEGEGYHLSSDSVPNCFLCQCPLPFLTCQGDMEHFQPPECEEVMFSSVLTMNNFCPAYHLKVCNLLHEVGSGKVCLNCYSLSCDQGDISMGRAILVSCSWVKLSALPSDEYSESCASSVPVVPNGGQSRNKFLRQSLCYLTLTLDSRAM